MADKQMNTLTYRIAAYFLGVVAISGNTLAQEVMVGITDRSWEAKTVPSIITTPPSQKEVNSLIAQLIDPDATACSFAFVDLGGSGQYNLVVSADFSGRRFCNTVLIIS